MAGIQNAVERAALSQISSFFGRTLRIEEVLEMVMDVAVRVVDAERGYIVVYDERTGAFVPRVAHAIELEDISSPEFLVARQIVNHVVWEREAMVTATGVPDADGGDGQVTRSAICVPMEGAERVIGAIYVEKPHHREEFLEHHLSMLNALSVNAAAAIDNARLFDQVEAERRKLDAVLRGTEQPIILADLEGTVLLMNRAAHRAFGTQEFQGTGMLLPQVIEHPELANLFEQARISEQIQHDEIDVAADRSYSATVTPIPGVGLVTVMQDITEIKKLSEIKSEFVATVSHDIRSPLSTVQGLLSILGQAGPLNDQQLDFVESAQQEVSRLFELTRDLLDLGRLDSGIGLEMEQCDLKGIIREEIAQWQSQAIERRHTLVADLPAEEVHVQGSPTLLRRMLDNLLSNAFKYTLSSGEIVVQLTQAGREAVLQVEDTGVGIPREAQPYVFDRFYRVQSDATRDVEGTGLGLAIVRSVAERHNGRVWVESEPGEGTTIGIVLPIAS
jgi:PAS domain S-box-containing protein